MEVEVISRRVSFLGGTNDGRVVDEQVDVVPGEVILKRFHGLKGRDGFQFMYRAGCLERCPFTCPCVQEALGIIKDGAGAGEARVGKQSDVSR